MLSNMNVLIILLWPIISLISHIFNSYCMQVQINMNTLSFMFHAASDVSSSTCALELWTTVARLNYSNSSSQNLFVRASVTDCCLKWMRDCCQPGKCRIESLTNMAATLLKLGPKAIIVKRTLSDREQHDEVHVYRPYRFIGYSISLVSLAFGVYCLVSSTWVTDERTGENCIYAVWCDR